MDVCSDTFTKPCLTRVTFNISGAHLFLEYLQMAAVWESLIGIVHVVRHYQIFRRAYAVVDSLSLAFEFSQQ